MRRCPALLYVACALFFVHTGHAHDKNTRIPNPFEDFDETQNTLRQISSRLPEHQAIALELMPVAAMLGLLVLCVFFAGCCCSCLCSKEMCDGVHKPASRCLARACCWPLLCGRGAYRKTAARCGRLKKKSK